MSLLSYPINPIFVFSHGPTWIMYESWTNWDKLNLLEYHHKVIYNNTQRQVVLTNFTFWKFEPFAHTTDEPLPIASIVSNALVPFWLVNTPLQYVFCYTKKKLMMFNQLIWTFLSVGFNWKPVVSGLQFQLISCCCKTLKKKKKSSHHKGVIEVAAVSDTLAFGLRQSRLL